MLTKPNGLGVGMTDVHRLGRAQEEGGDRQVRRNGNAMSVRSLTTSRLIDV